MAFWRKRSLARAADSTPDDAPDARSPGTNPHRDATLYWYTQDGYVIAHDQDCQTEYVQGAPCAACGGELLVIAQINRAWQGLNEVVAICRGCRARTSVIFDISNDVYQAWWADQLGELYVRQFENAPRAPYEPGP